MIVHQPEIRQENGRICVSSRIELSQSAINLPDTVWFCFPERFADKVSDRLDGFTVGMVLIATALKEKLELRGPVSSRLAFGIEEFQRTINLWYPKQYPLIDIRYEQLCAMAPGVEGDAVALAFSGGVDDFYTLWAHLPENQSICSARVTHGLFIQEQGFAPESKDKFVMLEQRYLTLFEQMGLELITVGTNLREFGLGRVDKMLFHGAPIFGAALTLAPLVRRFYISSTSDYMHIKPGGTSPVLDYWLSTETLEFMHFGSSSTALEKLAVLSKWPEAQNYLYV